MKTRVDQEGLLRREAEINAYEAQIKRLETLRDGRENAAVQIILEGAENGTKFATARLVELAGYGDDKDNATIRQLGGELKAYAAILNDVKDPEKGIERARGEIVKRKNLIKQIKANDGLLVE